MKNQFFFLVSFFLLFSCKKENTPIKNDFVGTQNIHYTENTGYLLLKSGKFEYKIQNSTVPFKKIILLNASLVGYISELGLEEKIIGISSPEYIYSEKIHQLIHQNKIQNIGNEQKYDLEKIIALKPDAIFTNYIGSFENTYDLLKKNGIKVIFIDDYTEQNPLDKTKIIEIFGKLLGEKEKSKAVFSKIKISYDSLKIVAKKLEKQPIVLANEMYGNEWFLPGGETNFAQFVSDANASYINKKNTDSKAIPMSFEEIFVKSKNAEIWVNIGNHKTKKELLQINPNYAKMNVYNKGKLYGVNAKEKASANDYFESGIVRADLVLKDYIKIFHPEIFPNYALTYMKELK